MNQRFRRKCHGFRTMATAILRSRKLGYTEIEEEEFVMKLPMTRTADSMTGRNRHIGVGEYIPIAHDLADSNQRIGLKMVIVQA
jgi:hypothetical protein